MVRNPDDLHALYSSVCRMFRHSNNLYELPNRIHRNTNLLNLPRKKRGNKENMKCKDWQKNKKEIGKSKPSFRLRLPSRENENRES